MNAINPQSDLINPLNFQRETNNITQLQQWQGTQALQTTTQGDPDTVQLARTKYVSPVAQSNDATELHFTDWIGKKEVFQALGEEFLRLRSDEIAALSEAHPKEIEKLKQAIQAGDYSQLFKGQFPGNVGEHSLLTSLPQFLINQFFNAGGRDLSGLEIGYLVDAHCPGANFRGADLSGVYAYYAHLVDANFTDTDLTDARFAGANLEGATFASSDNPKKTLSLSSFLDFPEDISRRQSLGNSGDGDEEPIIANLRNTTFENLKVSGGFMHAYLPYTQDTDSAGRVENREYDREAMSRFASQFQGAKFENCDLAWWPPTLVTMMREDYGVEFVNSPVTRT